MSNIQSEAVSYTSGGVTMNGHIFWDEDIQGERPGIIVVHEWWGCNDYAQGRARQLAELGYTGFAIDMYGDGQVAENPDQAGALMTAVLEDMATGRERFMTAMGVLGDHDTVDSSKLGAIGFCFGGGVVVHMARSGAPLSAVCSFHGSLGLVATNGPDSIHARAVAYNGADDVLVEDEAIEAFVSEMESVGADYQLVQLPGALHGFSNPIATTNGKKYGLPLAYNELADTVSWSHMQMVFADSFG